MGINRLSIVVHLDNLWGCEHHNVTDFEIERFLRIVELFQVFAFSLIDCMQQRLHR